MPHTPPWASTLAMRRADPTATLAQIADQLDLSRETVRNHLRKATEAGQDVPEQIVPRRLGIRQFDALNAVALGYVTDGPNPANRLWGALRADPGKPKTTITHSVEALRRKGLVVRDDTPGEDGRYPWRPTAKGAAILHWMHATYGAGPWGAWNGNARDIHRFVLRAAGEDLYVGWRNRDAVWCGTRQQAAGNGVSPTILDQADSTGTSSRSLMCGYTAQQIITAGGWLDRADLARYARLRAKGTELDHWSVQALLRPEEGS